MTRASNQLQRCSRAMFLLETMLAVADPGRQAVNTAMSLVELKKAEDSLKTEGQQGIRVVEQMHAYDEEVRQEVAQKSAPPAAAARGKKGQPLAELTAPRPIAIAAEALDGQGHQPRDAELKDNLGPFEVKSRGLNTTNWQNFTSKVLSDAQLKRMLAGQAQEQADNLREVIQATTSLDFFKRTVRALADNEGGPEARSCAVCMEDDIPLTKLAITPCAHAFCTECLTETVKKFKSCSVCRTPLQPDDVRPLSEEIGVLSSDPESSRHTPSSSSSSAPAAAAGVAGQAVRFDKYGTKLEAVVRKIQDLRRQDSTAKVIMFVQFDDLKRKVAASLAEFGIPAVQLGGSVAQRSGIIRDWQQNLASSTFVLLLSLAQSASGTNLTAASHVVFLHPMLAPTPEQAVGHELQAIGRARRHGQKRSTVHVWRFVTAGTVEQAITEKHQSALWAREQARGTIAAAAAAVAGASPLGEIDQAAARGAGAAARRVVRRR